MSIIRFSFIEAMMLQYQQINRGHLCRAFDFKEASATRLFRAYNQAHSENLIYNASARMYYPSNVFIAHNLKVDATVFLDAAQIMAKETIIQFKLM